MLDKGSYICAITAQGFNEAKTGNPQFWFDFDVQAKKTADGQAEQIDPEKRTYYRVITEKTMPFLLEDLRTIGYEGTSLAVLEPTHPQHVSLVGTVVEMYCGHDTYEGKQKERWGVSQGQPAREPLDKTKLRTLDSLFGKYARVAGAPAKAAAPKPAPVAAAAVPNGAPPPPVWDGDVF